jgi:PAS domain S-box-containing protein
MKIALRKDMLNAVPVRIKLTGLLIALVLITLCAAGFILYTERLDQLQQSQFELLHANAVLKARGIDAFIQEIQSDLDHITRQPVFDSIVSSRVAEEVFREGPFELLVGPGPDAGAYTRALETLAGFTNAVRIIVTDTEGDILYSTGSSPEFSSIREISGELDSRMVLAVRQGFFPGKIFKQNDKFMLVAGAPVRRQGTVDLLCYIQKPLEALYAVLDQGMDGAPTTETLLVVAQGKRAVIVNPLRSDPDAALDRGVFLEEEHGGAYREAVGGHEGSGYAIDYRGVETLAVWKPLQPPGWGLVMQIDSAELHEKAGASLRRFALYGIVIICISVLIGLLFTQYFINPLIALKRAMQSLSKGILPERIEKAFKDEIGDMTDTVNELVQSLQRTATFAERIGKGEFKAEYEPLSDGDILGNALLEMRKNLLENEIRDKERNWIVSGIAEISEILRAHNSIEGLGDAVVRFITDKVEAVQGAFYVVHGDNGSTSIELKSTFAYNKKKYLNRTFKFAEGLVGQTVAEQDTIMRTEIPDDYVSITSGILGDTRPKCVLITPLKAEDTVYGVLELAGFSRFTDSQVKFVEEMSLILARTIFNIKVNERTRQLLEESQEMSHELQEQQEVLRQNAEEMAATQEELKRTNQRLEDQVQEVNNTRNRMQLLLENASEVSAIYEEDGTVRYISPSVEKILGYTQEDMIGVKDEVHVHRDGIAQYREMFRAVMKNPFETATVQYEYVKSDGESIWLESTATNLLADSAIKGIVVNSRDITERRRAEREERMRTKMQALSENSPDLITRLNQEGEIFYINPVIESYTGRQPGDFLNHSIGEVHLDDMIKKQWTELLRRVETEHGKVEEELLFPSQIGERVMQVNAIPEYDEEDRMESVLMVSHDITERKRIELEIQSKNRKITESINYAQRIQSAILPNNAVIRQILPDSFIFYKARDVVSGDFPWFTMVGNSAYFAAVDCTGHGVPGALISLIGYFLLNDIIKGRKVEDPGLILDALDRSVTRTLRQEGVHANTKDGMDIALLRIDQDAGEITYAGAHRPLYHVHSGALSEIKGDKFPIGGGIYKNQTKFTSHRISVAKGDSLFFCSDGYPDQFGGPDNRKFGPKRLRDMLVKHNEKSMKQMHNLLETAWTSWKGDRKQTDDVLMIGVRF